MARSWQPLLLSLHLVPCVHALPLLRLLEGMEVVDVPVGERVEVLGPVREPWDLPVPPDERVPVVPHPEIRILSAEEPAVEGVQPPVDREFSEEGRCPVP